jgi:hypothetical protein
VDSPPDCGLAPVAGAAGALAQSGAPIMARKTQTPDPQTQTQAQTHTKPSKIESVVALLSRPEGASLAALSEATGWQAHSVRGALSGALKAKRGLTITSEKTEAGRLYRIADA